MKVTLTVAMLAVGIVVAVIGCDSTPQPPRPIIPREPTSAYQVPRTKAEKIAAIEKSGVSEPQKKAAIAKVNAGPD